MGIRCEELLKLMPRYPQKCVFFGHKGHSMDPILLEGDLLEVLPYKEGQVKIGDIIVFYSPDSDAIIAHRAVSVKPDGICTRGDNNMFDDPWCLHCSAVIGKVISATRYQKRRDVQGGLRGLVLARWHHRWYKLGRRCIYLIYPIYRLIPGLSILSQKILPGLGVHLIKPRVIVFRANDNRKIILQSGERIIGEYNAINGQWHINFLFSFFIDRSTLPDLEDEAS